MWGARPARRRRWRASFQWIVGAVVQAPYLGSIEARFVYFEPCTNKRLRRKFLHGEANGFRGPRETPVANGLAAHGATGEELRLGVIVKGRHIYVARLRRLSALVRAAGQERQSRLDVSRSGKTSTIQLWIAVVSNQRERQASMSR